MTMAPISYVESNEYSLDHRQERVKLTRVSDGISVWSSWWPCDGSASQDAWAKMRAAEKKYLQGVTP